MQQSNELKLKTYMLSTIQLQQITQTNKPICETTNKETNNSNERRITDVMILITTTKE